MRQHPSVSHDTSRAEEEHGNGDLHARQFDGKIRQIRLSVLLDGEIQAFGVSAVVPVHENAGGEGGDDATGADGELYISSCQRNL